MTAKVRSNIYLDSQLKEEAKKLFESYGLNFSSGISFLLRQTLEKKSLNSDTFLDLDIEPVYPDDPDYKYMQEVLKDRENGERFYTLEEVKKEFDLED